MLRAIVSSPINLLLVAAPGSWLLAWLSHESPWVFITAAASLIPLAGLIGLGTEQLARRAGPALGGFLNATFGNAAELIIAIVALGRGHVALVMPAVFDLSLYGNLSARPLAIDRLSFWSALILIGAYAGSLIYAFTVQRDLFRPTKEARHVHAFPIGAAVTVLAAGTVLTTIQAELLVGAMGPALARFGFSELFVGVIVVALIGNAAEHYSAVSAARQDEMTLAVEIAVGSSAQIALFVAPALVLYSFAMGHPMSLLFNAFEIAAIALSVLATCIVVVDGESNWVEGLQLLSVYLILALAFYFVPHVG